MKIKAYPVVTRAVEEGLAYGITRLFKYQPTDKMTEAELREHADTLVDHVMSAICEVVEFSDDDLGVRDDSIS